MSKIRNRPDVRVGAWGSGAGEVPFDLGLQRQLLFEGVGQLDGHEPAEVAPREAGEIVEVVRLGHEVAVAAQVGLGPELEGADVVGADGEGVEQGFELRVIVGLEVHHGFHVGEVQTDSGEAQQVLFPDPPGVLDVYPGTEVVRERVLVAPFARTVEVEPFGAEFPDEEAVFVRMHVAAGVDEGYGHFVAQTVRQQEPIALPALFGPEPGQEQREPRYAETRRVLDGGAPLGLRVVGDPGGGDRTQDFACLGFGRCVHAADHSPKMVGRQRLAEGPIRVIKSV